MPETILAIAAHNDDHLIGAGGALAKYAQEGKRVVTIICSFGENSHPHLRKEVIIKRRMRETTKSEKLLQTTNHHYLELREGHFQEDFNTKKQTIIHLIKTEKPSKIFTHGLQDAHPDHRAVSRIIKELMTKQIITCPVYAFEIWSVFRIRKRNEPRLVVDITKTFNTKLLAVLSHHSQTLLVGMLVWKLIIKDALSGIMHGHRYAEVFPLITSTTTR